MRNNVNSIWTESLTADLTRLWSHGYSCSQIGGMLGCTRNAVIGKAHRLGLASHERLRNRNGHTRKIDPKPRADPPEPGEQRRVRTRPNICQTVFKSRERKPRNDAIFKKPTPGLVQVVSALTGIPITMQGFRRRRAPAMTKNEMRAMLTTAIQNTAAMEMAE